MLTLQEILAREEGQTFDRKSINVDAKGLAVAITAMTATCMAVVLIVLTFIVLFERIA